MKILALEFSSPLRSVAVLDQSGVAPPIVLGAADAAGPEAKKAFGLIAQVLNTAGIEREAIEVVAVGLGPGSYTGIRSAIAIAQGWQLARLVRLRGVSSVDCLMSQAQVNGWHGRVHVVIDAQRGEFSMATCDVAAASIQVVQPLHLATREEVEARAQDGGRIIGPDVDRSFAQGHILYPCAAILGRLAALRDDHPQGSTLEPIYLRVASFVKAPPPRVLPVGE